MCRQVEFFRVSNTSCFISQLFAPYLPTVQYLRLDGKVSDRYSIVKQFEEDAEKTVLLCTTKVGGLGLNLISANICIFLELDYNPMVDLQVRHCKERSEELRIR